MQRIADLFCGAGGAGRGLQQAGFYVVGFDTSPQPRYAGDEFRQQDALTVELSEFDAVWASPPCQKYSRATPNKHKVNHWDSIPPTRTFLEASGLPYIIENVPCSPLKTKVFLNGAMFGSAVRRERWFESNIPLRQPWLTNWTGPALHFGGNSQGRSVASRDELSKEMGIDWMTRVELGQAIPPAYSKFLGEQMMAYLSER